MVTILEIARVSGFSKSTVSAVLSNHGETNHASSRACEKILEIAHCLGYTPNQAARSLRRKCSNLIAILDVTHFSSYSPEILHGINDVICRNHCQQMHCMFQEEQELSEQLAHLEEYRPDGWIVIGYLKPEIRGIIDNLIKSGKRVVQVCTTELQPGASAVYVNPCEIGKMAAEYLLQNGHRHIIYAAKPQGDECLKGFAETFREHGLDFQKECVCYDTVDEKSGRCLLHEWMKQGRKETAVFAFSDAVAGAILSEAYATHVRVPDELSVMGINNQAFSSLFSPALTTVGLPQYDRGVLTGEVMMTLLKNRKETPEIRYMSPAIVERKSVKSFVCPSR